MKMDYGPVFDIGLGPIDHNIKIPETTERLQIRTRGRVFVRSLWDGGDRHITQVVKAELYRHLITGTLYLAWELESGFRQSERVREAWFTSRFYRLLGRDKPLTWK